MRLHILIVVRDKNLACCWGNGDQPPQVRTCRQCVAFKVQISRRSVCITQRLTCVTCDWGARLYSIVPCWLTVTTIESSERCKHHGASLSIIVMIWREQRKVCCLARLNLHDAWPNSTHWFYLGTVASALLSSCSSSLKMITGVRWMYSHQCLTRANLGCLQTSASDKATKALYYITTIIQTRPTKAKVKSMGWSFI